MSNGPRPSQLCLLSALPLRKVGDKVRFLGCVLSYSPATGVLTLQHHLQEDASPVLVLVDVNLVLESLGADQTRVGEWVNVIGYITAIASMSDGKGPLHGSPRVNVQAILLWSSGPLDVPRYEESVKALNTEESTDSRPRGT
ncbi:hypothetical protein VTK26DRAFT_4935 [Humicola hyalothermophila]